MEGFYIFLGIMGIICVILSFMLSEKIEGRGKNDGTALSEEQLQNLLNTSQEALEKALTMHAKHTKEAAMEETEKALARLTNEKIMAVDEFSDTVLEKINQNHSEVIFLYNMLNEKEKELKELVSSINGGDYKKVASKGNEMEKNSHTNEQDTGNQKNSSQKDSQKSVKEEMARQKAREQLPSTDKGKEAAAREEILSLHQQGLSVTDIAKQLKIGKGEVKLIIDLYQGAR